MTLLGQSTGSGFVTGLKDKFSDVKKTATNLMDNVVDTVKGMASGIPNVFKDMLDKEDEWLRQKDDSTGTGGSTTTTTSTTGKGGKGGRGRSSLPQTVEAVSTVGQGLSQLNHYAYLDERLAELNKNIAGMKIVMDNGVLVGQIVAPIDERLGKESLYQGRR